MCLSHTKTVSFINRKKGNQQKKASIHSSLQVSMPAFIQYHTQCAPDTFCYKLYLFSNSKDSAAGFCCVFFFHGVVFIPKPHLSWVSLRLVRWISAPQGLLQLKYFNLTKHLIYFISPMRKAVCLNRACQPTVPFTAIYRQPGTLEEKSAVILYFILLQKAPKSSYSLLLHVAF